MIWYQLLHVLSFIKEEKEKEMLLVFHNYDNCYNSDNPIVWEGRIIE